MQLRFPTAIVHVSPALTVFANDGVPLNDTRLFEPAELSMISLSAHVPAGALGTVTAPVFALVADAAAAVAKPFSGTPPTAPAAEWV